MWNEVKKLSDFWKTVLQESEITGNKLFLKTQMDRKQYVELNKILELLWWKRNRKEKCHIFDVNNLQEAINEVCDTMEVIDVKVLYQQFYTPSELAKKLVELADIQKTNDVLEPSAGQGAIVKEILKKEFRDLFITEIDKNNIDYLQEIKNEHKENNPQSDSILLIENWDFIEKTNIWIVDKIIANPPFSKSQDVKHILEMYKYLKRGWRIVSIASSSIQTRSGKLYDEFKSLDPEFIEIEDWAFKESWTMVNSVIVIINKF